MSYNDEDGIDGPFDRACSRIPNPNLEALTILRRELTPNARVALAHLLNNGLCSVVCEASMPKVHMPSLQGAIDNLREIVRQVLRD